MDDTVVTTELKLTAEEAQWLEEKLAKVFDTASDEDREQALRFMEALP